ncbi:MMPL family transporter [Natrinema sp. 1APR25-10V2]|uniref:efflux RND transporter permease subunit n=1 Tax=Natrinema sp. 1APR25-10V2 TaxID=2951081 RepID=UPI002876F2FE|nr:MMPL family transporter [Natrinema sp. 1APR25-10V2]MDS0476463.1 MMPL family transporter [Natrinema sp. 1APR25-10V2]
MVRDVLDRCIDAVTSHNRIVIVVLLLMTAGMVVGMGNLDTSSQAGGGDVGETTAERKAAYIDEHYGDGSDRRENVSVAAVYVRAEDGNVLSKAALLESLEYQRAVLENESVSAALADERGITGVANVIATRAAGDRNATLEEQIAALESTDDDEVEALVAETLTEESGALSLLPRSYDPGSATAESRRTVFRFETDGTAESAGVPSDAQRALYEAATERDDPNYFTLGEHAVGDLNRQMYDNTVTLVLPVALALILGILAFTYRDLIDVVVGMIGVVVSIVWMFGILGWLGVSAGITMIIGPVMIAGISIDFGFHVFMRYREQRGSDEGIRPPMFRSVRSVAVALVLVTVTTAIGFLSNVVNPVNSIRNMAIGITLGVISAFVIFVTLVPALKISLDGLCERVGLERRKEPLGHGRYLRRALGGSVGLAKRAAPVVIVVALVAGTAGAMAWPALDQASYQQQTEPVDDWKTELPGPMAWEESAFIENRLYVTEQYQSSSDDTGRSQLLIEGDVTADAALEQVDSGVERAHETGVAFDRQGTDSVVSPLSVMKVAAAENESFAATLEAADANDDGIPDRDIESVYDHLFAVAPDEASQVIERTDEGEYRSLRLLVTVDRSETADERADGMQAAAAAIEDGDADLTATAAGPAAVMQAELSEVTEGILYVLLLALGVIAVSLVGIYRLTEGSASLGAVTVVPIVLVAGLVIGSMFLLDVPLTLLTALLMSLVVGLGIDYNIHVSDRFAQELERRGSAYEALEAAVVGTGGALLGSTLTSAAAFLALLLHPHPQIESLGLLVVLALVTSFLVSVLVLPSMLALWARYADVSRVAGDAEPTPATTVDD